VSFEARVGTITAIVGPTGSGKSTLMALLLRLFDPETGHIEIDGIDLRRLTLESLRKKVAIALQENLLFGATVRENIRYAVPNASDAAVREAARVACAQEFIEKLPQGYDTLLGERGTKLSSGQRQRLSIARAVLKDAPILVLDEPTASLDAETEMQVLGNLARWGRGRAIFLITHRLSTIRRAGQILYLADGRVVEIGSHEELVAREDSAYRRLVELETAPTAVRVSR
jgi:ABC-type multidrug transport system fused ATPase/permease subunit